MIHQQTRLPHPYKLDWGGPPAVQQVLGGLRKTTNQNIGNLAAAYVNIVDYQAPVFNDEFGIVSDLTAGTIMLTRLGDYLLNVNLECTFTSDNNSSRNTNLRLFNVSDNIAVPNALTALYAGAYTAGFQSSIVTFITRQAPVNKLFRLQVGGGSTFNAFNILQAAFVLTSIGPV